MEDVKKTRLLTELAWYVEVGSGPGQGKASPAAT